ncbi:MAG: sporulation transcription factor Spo0A [Clostridia bacterium]
MKKIKLLLVDDNADLLATIKDSYLGDNEVDIIGSATDGLDAIAKIESFAPDVVLLDIVMPKLDGFGVLKNLDYSKLPRRPKFIIMSGLSGDSFISKSISLGAAYFLAKPANIDNIKERVREFGGLSAPTAVAPTQLDERLIAQAVRRSQLNLDEKLANIFISVGIPAHIKGYQFLRDAIKMAIDSPDIINSITKKLYPSIATHFETSASKVERAIRHAIEVAWNRGKIENINNIFGLKVYSANDKPTNGEFIALLADKMIMEGA